MSENTIVILQARLSSSRLPCKVLLCINGKPMIFWQIQRILRIKSISRLVVAIPDEKSDDRLAEYLDSIDQTYVRGSHLDVLERFLKVEKIFKPKTIIRVTADCPLVMPELIDDFIEIFHKKDVEYLSNVLTPTFPDGLDIEIFKAGVLTKLNYFDLSEFEREHVTLGLIKRKQMFSTFNVELNTNLSNYRWTIDTKSDFEFLEKIFNVFNSKEITLNFKELLDFLERFPAYNQIQERANIN